MSEIQLIKSSINYTGNKWKLLPKLLELFPKDVSTFVDMFGGGGTLSINVKADKTIYNDIVPYVANVFIGLQKETSKSALIKINAVINKYKLSKTNKVGFESLRNAYNLGERSWENFYVLMQYSFNYNYRFNSEHKYNMPHGKNRSEFTKRTEEKLIKFINKLRDMDITFITKDFRKVDLSSLDDKSFVYVDCPYLISTANYNDGKRGFTGWTTVEELELLSLLDSLNERKIKFGLSNVLSLDGKTNEILSKWSKKYTVHHLSMDYSNCNYQKKDKTNSDTDECYICNY
jgi:DNA adenine methylase Dam